MGRKKSKSCVDRRLRLVIEAQSTHEAKSRDELIEEIVDLILKNEKLKKRLRKYENPNTPPSKDERKSRTKFVSKTGLSVGKKIGYKGKTREKKEPTNFINLFQGVCPKCGKHNRPKEVREKTYEEIPEPQQIKVVKAKWGYYECDCGHCWESKPQEAPEKGLFGKNAQTHIVLLKFDDRLPLRKTVSALERQFDLTLTSKAIYDITKRVADTITPDYIEIRKKIRRAKHLNIDETKIKIQGVWYYVWIFRSRKYIYFVIRIERNKNVLDEILGYHYKGSITCDGLSAYEAYTKYLQRCWAHILRETEEYADKYEDAKPMHNWMEDLFEKVKNVTLRDPMRKREKIYNKCIAEMKILIQIYSSYQHLGEIITKIKNGLPYWFTRILHPQIEPTNNKAEQPLREIKVIQKIIGTLRNEDGASIMEKIMTFLATWRLQGKNNFIELRSLL